MQIRGIYEDVKLNTLYDVLHDPVYRKTWDPNILEGEEICRIDVNSDVGYYASSYTWIYLYTSQHVLCPF